MDVGSECREYNYIYIDDPGQGVRWPGTLSQSSVNSNDDPDNEVHIEECSYDQAEGSISQGVFCAETIREWLHRATPRRCRAALHDNHLELNYDSHSHLCHMNICVVGGVVECVNVLAPPP